MLEQDFKQALRDTMATVTTPTMSETALLDAARRADRRRRAGLASAASGVAVVALATGVALALPGEDRSGSDGGSDVGVEVTSTNPGGRTAYSGPHFEQGVDLLNKLLEVAPPGYYVPDDLESTLEPAVPPRFHDAVGSDDGSWTYAAGIPLVKAGRYGSLLISLFADPDAASRDETPCEFSIGALGPTILVPSTTDPNPSASCTEVTVAGQQVGVATKPGAMLVSYRHPDGTRVVLSQDVRTTDFGYPALAELPFTGEQLAELAADPRFLPD